MTLTQTRITASNRVPLRAIRWLWAPYVPLGMMTLVAGVPGQGKSLFTCWLAAQVSKKRRVLMSNSEDDYSLILRPRLQAAGATLRNIDLMHPIPLLPRETDTLLREIDKRGPSLVILDPLQDHLEVSIFSPKATHVLAPLARELAARDVAMVVVSHTVKALPKGAHPLYAVGGAAGGLSRVVRVVHLFGTHPTDAAQRILAPTKINFLPDDQRVSAAFSPAQHEIRRGKLLIQPGVLRYLGPEPEVTPTMLVHPPAAENGHRAHGDRRLQAAHWLRSRLSLAPQNRLPVKQIQAEAEQADIAWATIRRADDDIVHVTKVRVGEKGRRGGHATYWQLPRED